MAISVGSVSVDVVPSTRGFAERLKAKLKGLTVNIPVEVDTSKVRAQVEESTKSNRPRIKVDADTDAFTAKIRADAARISKSALVDLPITADAERLRRDIKTQTELISKLTKIEIPVDIEEATALRSKMAVELDILKAMAASANPTVNVDADTGAAEAKIAAVTRDRHANVSVGGITAATQGISGLALAIITLGPALIPITAAIAGLGAALVAPLALAGGGLTIGAILGGFAIKDTLEQKKQIADLAKKVDASRLALSKATTPSGKRSAQLQLAADTKAYQAALAALSPAQNKFLDSLDKLKGSFKGLLASTGGALFAPFIKGMDLLAKIMPSLKPLVTGVSRAIGTLLDDLGKAASGPGFKAFMRTFGREAGRAIVAFGRMFGNFGKGLFGLFRAFGPVSAGFVKGLSGTAKSFADWSKNLGSSKSFQSFLTYVRDVGPKVATALGHIFGALGKIAAVLAPLGGVALALLDGLSKFIINAKPGQIAAIGYALGVVAVAVAALGGPAIAIPAALLAIGGAFAFAYTHSEPFRKVIDGVGRVFTDHLLPALRDAAQKVFPAIVSAFDSVKKSVHDNQGLFRVLGDVLKLWGKTLVDVVIPALATFYSVAIPALGKAIGLAITSVRLLANGWLLMARAGLEAFRLLVTAALSTFDTILTAADKALGWLPKFGPKIHDARQSFDDFKSGTVAALNAAIGKVRDLQSELNTIKPKTVKIHFQVDKPPALLAPGGLPIFKPEGAGATGAIVNRPTVALIGESGPEALVPLSQTPGNAALPTGGRTGPQFNVERVVAQDVNDFLLQMQVRSRQAGIGGVPQ